MCVSVIDWELEQASYIDSRVSIEKVTPQAIYFGKISNWKNN